jgi:3-isopropylmalate/(R)-2-methylmalate dehydratase small subunit
MKPLNQHQGIVAPMDRANVDTDAIIPKQFLKSIKRSGFGPHLFDAWRYEDEGQPGVDCSKRPLRKDFVLNQPRYKGASILVARRNFGCGSSREHAPWALEDYGFRVVIAPSYADIFFNNCFKNGVLPIVLSEDDVEQIFQMIAANEGFELKVDLSAQTLSSVDGKFSRKFDVEPFRKHCLINGLDDIGLTLQHADKIKSYETKRLAEKPWLAVDMHAVMDR